MIKRILVAVVFLFIVKPVGAVDYAIPPYGGWVNDFADLYSEEFEIKLENELEKLEKETGVEVAVATIKKLPETTIEEYAVEMFEKWGIGKKDKDNGVLLLISEKDRKIRIEVGYRLEGVINDGRAGGIIRNEIGPKFKEEDYEGGTWDGVEKIIYYVKEASPPSQEAPTFTEVTAGKLARQGKNKNISGGWVIVGFVVIIYLMSFLGRSKEWTTGGVIGLVAGLFIKGLFLGIVFGILGLILDFILSNNYKKLKKKGKSTSFWKSGGGFSSGGGGGGGFGGFGGGSSGGGGASGGW